MVLSTREVKDLEELLNELKTDDVLDGFDEALKTLSTYTEIYNKPQYDMIKIKENDKMVAFCVGEQREDDYYIIMSYVSRDNRRKGLGLKMKNEMMQKAYNRNCESIYSTVRSDNTASYNMNLKAGWEIARAWYRFKKDLKRDKDGKNLELD